MLCLLEVVEQRLACVGQRGALVAALPEHLIPLPACCMHSLATSISGTSSLVFVVTSVTAAFRSGCTHNEVLAR